MGNFVYDVSKGEPIFTGEYFTFDMYFASLASMRHHPGAGTKDHKKLTLQECADEAIEMLKIRRAIPIFEPVKKGEKILDPNKVGVSNEQE
jgi:hypothetical protein